MSRLTKLFAASAVVQYCFVAQAFTPSSSPGSTNTGSTRGKPMFGISEWRDLPVDQALSHLTDEVPRRLPVLLTGSHKVTLLGETNYYQWNRDDDVRLFQQAVDKNEGMFGLGFVHDPSADDGEVILDKIALMQIEDYNIMGQDFGIFCSSKAVGRASILHTEKCNDEDEPLMVWCNEIFDRQEIKSLEEANVLARNVVEILMKLSKADKLQLSETVAQPENSENRIDRFRVAMEAAHLVDSQGYHVSSSDRKRCEERNLLSWSEINAISWAAFSTSTSLETDKTYRLRAMDFELITNRLQLANYWLSDVLVEATH